MSTEPIRLTREEVLARIPDHSGTCKWCMGTIDRIFEAAEREAEFDWRHTYRVVELHVGRGVPGGS